jgi:NhaA family Na+:H+ antiporter
LANSPFSHLYESFLNVPVQVRIAELNLEKPLVLWINDGLMAIFFFLIGLEIKREVMIGHLSQPSLVVLPAIAAVAGILAPAMIYAWFNYGNEIAIRGWAIPSATDIAFALGVFSLFKTRVPISLKLFLLSVAIFDDLGAIIIIAIFYSSDLSIASLAVAAAGILVLGLLNYLNVRRQAAYLLMGLVIWIAVLKSGVHATLAGFAIALFIPLSLKNEDGHPMLPHLEHTLHPWVAFLILPLFAFANAGVNLEGVNWDALSNSVTLGIALGLIIGKQLGIFAVCALVIKLGWAKLPEGASWLQFYAVSILCGIGFTMSLFIGTLAFEGLPAEYLTQVKLGVLLGSFISAILAAGILMMAKPLPEE